MGLNVYPYDYASLEPRPMNARQIWRIAEQVRRQVEPRRATPTLDLDRVLKASSNMIINNSNIAAHWDLDRCIVDGNDREALGVTEADPALPGMVIVGLNAAVIADRDYLKRSTLAHELGHVLFDGPSMVRQAGGRAFAMVTPDEQHLATSTAGSGTDWREFRANEFMGALLVPRALLHREMIHAAIALGLRLVDAGESQPMLRRAGAEPMRLEQLLLDLGERFGVSPNFVEYRLRRYALIQ